MQILVSPINLNRSFILYTALIISTYCESKTIVDDQQFIRNACSRALAPYTYIYDHWKMIPRTYNTEQLLTTFAFQSDG